MRRSAAACRSPTTSAGSRRTTTSAGRANTSHRWLYLAVGISGRPPSTSRVRGAKVVAAVNSDPDARIFRSADFGIVGDLYEVVPALIDVLGQ